MLVYSHGQTNGSSELEPPVPATAENYPSAQLFEDVIESTFMDEKLLDMVEGPLSEQEAADLCGCLINDLCVGAMAGIQEVDKVRTIIDATIIGVNDNIRADTDKKTTVPALWPPLRQASPVGSEPDLVQVGCEQGPSQDQGAQEALEVHGGQDQGQVLGQQGGHVWCGLGAALLGSIGGGPHAFVLPHLGDLPLGDGLCG